MKDNNRVLVNMDMLTGQIRYIGSTMLSCNKNNTSNINNTNNISINNISINNSITNKSIYTNITTLINKINTNNLLGLGTVPAATISTSTSTNTTTTSNPSLK